MIQFPEIVNVVLPEALRTAVPGIVTLPVMLQFVLLMVEAPPVISVRLPLKLTVPTAAPLPTTLPGFNDVEPVMASVSATSNCKTDVGFIVRPEENTLFPTAELVNFKVPLFVTEPFTDRLTPCTSMEFPKGTIRLPLITNAFVVDPAEVVTRQFPDDVKFPVQVNVLVFVGKSMDPEQLISEILRVTVIVMMSLLKMITLSVAKGTTPPAQVAPLVQVPPPVPLDVIVAENPVKEINISKRIKKLK